MKKFLLINIILFTCFLLIINKKETNEFVEINENIKKIQANIEIKQGLFFAKGFIAYEKENNFKMICYSFLGKEIEIGSNKDFFWFWTRKENILYYCKQGKINTTRLRKMFYPEILKSFLGIDENYIIINNDLKKISILQDKKIISHKLYQNDNLILQCDVVDFYGNLPRKIKLNWIEENIKQEWILSNIKINSDFSDWEFPDYKNKINLENY
jgi:hypothetical protein